MARGFVITADTIDHYSAIADFWRWATKEWLDVVRGKKPVDVVVTTADIDALVAKFYAGMVRETADIVKKAEHQLEHTRKMMEHPAGKAASDFINAMSGHYGADAFDPVVIAENYLDNVRRAFSPETMAKKCDLVRATLDVMLHLNGTDTPVQRSTNAEVHGGPSGAETLPEESTLHVHPVLEPTGAVPAGPAAGTAPPAAEEGAEGASAEGERRSTCGG